MLLRLSFKQHPPQMSLQFTSPWMLIQVLELALRIVNGSSSSHLPGRTCFTYTNPVLGAIDQYATWTVRVNQPQPELRSWF